MIAQAQPNADDLLEFMYHSALGVVQTDLEGAVRMLNPVAIQLLMPLASQGDRLNNLFVTLDGLLPDLREIVTHAQDRFGTVIDRHRIALPNGVRGRNEPVFLALSIFKVAADLLIATLEDVSATVRQEQLLGKQEAWINAMYAGTSRHAHILIDGSGRIAGWSPQMTTLTGFSASEFLGQPYSALFAEDAMTNDLMSDRLDEVDRVGLSLAEGRMRRADGSAYWGHSIITRVPSERDPGGYTLLIRDIDDRRETVESLLKAASSDPLTGVANRRALYEAADIEFARYARKPRDISLLLIDIDHFKQVNDTHGHPVGDEVIRNLASVLVRSVRSIDMVARIGGEEFAVMLPSTDVSMAMRIAERIRANVGAQRITAGSVELDYRVSVGIARVSADMHGIDDLIMAADLALYDAKRQGRDRVCCRT